MKNRKINFSGFFYAKKAKGKKAKGKKAKRQT